MKQNIEAVSYLLVRSLNGSMKMVSRYFGIMINNNNDGSNNGDDSVDNCNDLIPI